MDDHDWIFPLFMAVVIFLFGIHIGCGLMDGSWKTAAIKHHAGKRVVSQSADVVEFKWNDELAQPEEATK